MTSNLIYIYIFYIYMDKLYMMYVIYCVDIYDRKTF